MALDDEKYSLPEKLVLRSKMFVCLWPKLSIPGVDQMVGLWFL
ncbi:hypothetical protein [Bartonella sp. LJL80]